MSALCFAIAFVLAGLSALGVNIPHAIYWILTALAAGLFTWTIGLPGWTIPRRTR